MNDVLQFELKLSREEEPQRTATAWLITGSDPLAWLEELAGWQLNEADLRLFVMPHSRTDLSPSGLFVIAGEGGKPARAPAAMAFGTVAVGVYIPVHANLLPPVESRELESLRLYQVLVFHPSIGPVGFDRENALTCADLLAVPPERERFWISPPIEPTPHPRIESIALRSAPVSFEELFGDESADIGSEPSEDITKVPAPPKETPITRGLDALRDFPAKAANWLLSQGNRPGGIGKAGRPNPFMLWLVDHLPRPVPRTPKELAARNRALGELIDQLKNNPEEGLKRALPLASAGLNRGFANSGNSLGKRATDFSLDRIGGGRAVDPWELQESIRQELRDQYLRLAEHERQLGRFRRAAYIHAELLGDLPAAASVLAEGNYWREAALLYRDNMHNPLEAARCFVRARMIPEAVEIYKKEGADEKLGDLYKMLGNEEKAVAAYRDWANRLTDQRKLLEASVVLEEKLAAREEALNLLESAWPHNPARQLCLDKWFSMRGKAGEHEAATKLLNRLVAETQSTQSATDLVRLFTALQPNYPDRTVRLHAEDLGRQLIARSLRGAENASAQKQTALLHLLPALAPDDRLLARDSIRFLSSQARKSSKSKTPKKQSKTPDRIVPTGSHLIELTSINDFNLGGMRWLKAVISPGGLWAVGLLQNHGVTVTRATFDGRLQRTSWDDRLDLGQCKPADMLLSTSNANSERVFLSAIGASPLAERTLSRDDCFAREAVIGTPSWLKSPVLASAHDANEGLWVVRDTPTGGVISGHLPNGQIITNFPAPAVSELPLPGMGMIYLAAIGPQLVCAVGNKLHRFGSSMDSIHAFPSSEIEFDEPIFGLQPGPRWGMQCALVKLESQIGLCWFTSQGTRSYVYDQVGHEAATGFTSDGLIVAITGEGGLIFAADSRGKLRSARFPWKEPIPLAIGCGSGAGTFCSMSAEGQVQIFGFSQSELR